MMKYKVYYTRGSSETFDEVDAGRFDINISEKGTMSVVFYKTDRTPIAAYNGVSRIISNELEQK